MGDAFGRAILDTLRDDRRGPVEYRPAVEPGKRRSEDGQTAAQDDEREAAFVERYFAEPEAWPDREHALLEGLGGRILDLGCGAGRHALHLQDRPDVTEVVATDVSPRSVVATWEQGVERSVVSHMAFLPFSDEAFDHVVCLGSQLCSGTTLDDVAANLDEAARVTAPGGTLVADCFDPRDSDDWDWFGYEDDPRTGVGRRRFDVTYAGDRTRIELTLLSPARLESLAEDAGWLVEFVDRDGAIYSMRFERAVDSTRRDTEDSTT